MLFIGENAPPKLVDLPKVSIIQILFAVADANLDIVLAAPTLSTTAIP